MRLSLAVAAWLAAYLVCSPTALAAQLADEARDSVSIIADSIATGAVASKGLDIEEAQVPAWTAEPVDQADLTAVAAAMLKAPISDDAPLIELLRALPTTSGQTIGSIASAVAAFRATHPDQIARAHGEGLVALLQFSKGHGSAAYRGLETIIRDPSLREDSVALVTAHVYLKEGFEQYRRTNPTWRPALDRGFGNAPDGLNFSPNADVAYMEFGTPVERAILAIGLPYSSHLPTRFGSLAASMSDPDFAAALPTALLVRIALMVGPEGQAQSSDYTLHIFRSEALSRTDLHPDDFVRLTLVAARKTLYESNQCNGIKEEAIQDAARAISGSGGADPIILAEAAARFDAMCMNHGTSRHIVFREDALLLLARALEAADRMYATDSTDPAILGAYAAVLREAERIDDTVIAFETQSRLEAFSRLEIDPWNTELLRRSAGGRAFIESRQ